MGKGWEQNFQAIKIFLEQNPDAKKDTAVFVHTDPENPKGRNLLELSGDYLYRPYTCKGDASVEKSSAVDRTYFHIPLSPSQAKPRKNRKVIV